jgi:hypothetical protein
MFVGNDNDEVEVEVSEIFNSQSGIAGIADDWLSAAEPSAR